MVFEFVETFKFRLYPAFPDRDPGGCPIQGFQEPVKRWGVAGEGIQAETGPRQLSARKGSGRDPAKHGGNMNKKTCLLFETCYNRVSGVESENIVYICYKSPCAVAKRYVNPCMMMCFFQENKSRGVVQHALILCPQADD